MGCDLSRSPASGSRRRLLAGGIGQHVHPGDASGHHLSMLQVTTMIVITTTISVIAIITITSTFTVHELYSPLHLIVLRGPLQLSVAMCCTSASDSGSTAVCICWARLRQPPARMRTLRSPLQRSFQGLGQQLRVEVFSWRVSF